MSSDDEVQRLLNDQKFEDDMREVVNKLGDLINNFDTRGQADAFCKALMRQHRTLQQNFWGVMIKVIFEYAETDRYDLRNEASVQLCKKLKKFLEEEGWLALPCI